MPKNQLTKCFPCRFEVFMSTREMYRKIGKSHTLSFPPWIGSPLPPLPPLLMAPCNPGRLRRRLSQSKRRRRRRRKEEEEEGEGGHILPPPNPISTFWVLQKNHSVSRSLSISHSFFFLSCRFVSKSAVRRKEEEEEEEERRETGPPPLPYSPALSPTPKLPRKKKCGKYR